MVADKLKTNYHWTGHEYDPNDELFGHIIENTAPEDAHNYDAVLVGEPYDGGQVGTRGAAAGPDGVRHGIDETKTATLDNGAVSKVGDLGNMDIPWGRDVTETQAFIREITTEIHELDTFPVFIGGGHDLGYPNAAPLLEQHDSVAVVNFDAHADVREVVDRPYNGSPFRQVFEEGLDEYVFVGARHFETSTPYLEFLEEHNATTISAEEVGLDPLGTVDRIIDAVGDVDAVYVSSDLDVLDMTFAPATTAPTPGGLTSREFFMCLRNLVAKEERIVGYDVIGNAPPLESKDQRLAGANIGRTGQAGARAVAHVIAGLQAR